MPKARWVRGIVLGSAWLLLAGAPAVANQFWVAYEGDDYPENVGWNRNYGDETGGPPHGGAHRSIADGGLTLDSLFNDQVYDYYEMSRSTTPGATELFVAEWRMMVDARSDDFDALVGIAGGVVPADVVFGLGWDGLHVNYYEAVISLAPDSFHSFRFATTDMVRYELLIDGSISYAGIMRRGLLAGGVSFGDGVMGQASLSDWDYVRFGIVPEPTALALAVAGAVRIRKAMRRRSAGGRGRYEDGEPEMGVMRAGCGDAARRRDHRTRRVPPAAVG